MSKSIHIGFLWDRDRYWILSGSVKCFEWNMATLGLAPLVRFMSGDKTRSYRQHNPPFSVWEVVWPTLLVVQTVCMKRHIRMKNRQKRRKHERQKKMLWITHLSRSAGRPSEIDREVKLPISVSQWERYKQVLRGLVFWAVICSGTLWRQLSWHAWEKKRCGFVWDYVVCVIFCG